MKIKEILHTCQEEMKKAEDALERQFLTVRTGRARSSLIEGLYVNYYGTPTLLKQLASISVPEATLLLIQPWDPSIITEIEKAILKSNLGISPSNDGKLIRLSFPPLSKERREEIVKLIKKMAEEGRISLRTIRQKTKEAIEKLEKDKVIPEDDKFRGFQGLQKLIDKYNTQLEEILKSKEKEILEL
ncbi:MAG: ribosome recycling factor [Candidatus Omnitrophica bacterium]|nr:ribosome recycling factor [Candidatus Omnitrophota bacterium]